MYTLDLYLLTMSTSGSKEYFEVGCFNTVQRLGHTWALEVYNDACFGYMIPNAHCSYVRIASHALVGLSISTNCGYLQT